MVALSLTSWMIYYWLILYSITEYETCARSCVLNNRFWYWNFNQKRKKKKKKKEEKSHWKSVIWVLFPHSTVRLRHTWRGTAVAFPLRNKLATLTTTLTNNRAKLKNWGSPGGDGDEETVIEENQSPPLKWNGGDLPTKIRIREQRTKSKKKTQWSNR